MSRLARAAVLAGVAAVLGACAVGPNYHHPDTKLNEAFEAAPLVAPGEGEIDREWWKAFGDPLLDELVATSVTANRDIAAATARLKQARALRRERLFDFLPAVKGNASYTNSRQSLGTFAAQGFPPNLGIRRDTELFDAGFDASWELDLFGRLRRQNESARAAAQAANAARNQVVLSVIAEVARNYFELRGAQDRLTVARNNADTQSKALELVNSRLEAGSGTALDSSRAIAQVETTLASVPPLEASVDRAIRRIAVLTGAQPQVLRERLTVEKPMPQMPAGLVLGNPEQLLRRRPDIRVAERQLAGATADVGVQVADLFPRVTVNAGIGLAAPRVSQLDDAGNDRRSFAPSLSWGLFDFGHVYQRIRGANARTAEALASYEQTVLLALEETENALSDYAREKARMEHLARAAQASGSASDLAGQRFESGVSDFLTALDAYRTSLDAQDQLAQSRTRAATALVAIYKALGGGWEAAPQPE